MTWTLSISCVDFEKNLFEGFDKNAPDMGSKSSIKPLKASVHFFGNKSRQEEIV
jgi:hypothetical protein